MEDDVTDPTDYISTCPDCNCFDFLIDDNYYIELNREKSVNHVEKQEKSVIFNDTSNPQNEVMSFTGNSDSVSHSKRKDTQDEVRCFTGISDSDSHSKRKDKRCRLPTVDPVISMEWHQKSMSQVDLLSYTIGVFSDLIPKDLAKCWIKQLGRLVSLPEKEDITALTQSEMDLMRKRYSE